MLTAFKNSDDLIPRADRFADDCVAEGWYSIELLNETIGLNRSDMEPTNYRPAGMS